MKSAPNQRPGLIVLGSGISYDGTPSGITEQNARTAAQMINTGVVDPSDIYVLGGGPDASFRYRTSEADIMTDMLRQDVDQDILDVARFHLGTQSTNTFENMEEFTASYGDSGSNTTEFLTVASSGHAQRAATIGNQAYRYANLRFTAHPTEAAIEKITLRKEQVLRGLAAASFVGIGITDPMLRIIVASKRYTKLTQPIKQKAVAITGERNRYASNHA